MRLLRKEFKLPYELIWDKSERHVALIAGEDLLEPTFGAGDICFDYALVVRAGLRELPRLDLVLISGCHMWGSWGAAVALTNSDLLSEVRKRLGKRCQDYAIVMRIPHTEGEIKDAELVSCAPLERKTSGGRIGSVGRPPPF